MIALQDLLVIVAIAVACALVVCGVAVVVLLRWRSASLLAQVCVVVGAAVVAALAGMVAVAQAMYLSPHDLVVALWVAGVSGVVALGGASVLGLWLAREVRRVRTLTREVGEGRTVRAVPGAGGGDLAELASVLAETSEKLALARDEAARTESARRDLVAWISHDLRTPLAGLRAMTEALEDGLADDPELYYRRMHAQVDRLSGMVDDLFELSRIHSGTLSLTLEPLALYDLVSDAVAELAPLARSRAVSLSQSGPTDLTVVGDARELARVVGNLLINAIQHSPAGSEIQVMTTAEPGARAAVGVVDAGGGIPEADLTRVFEAGWRGSSARTPPAALAATGDAGSGRTADDAPEGGRRVRDQPVPGGAGLGLAIARGIAEAHSGAVQVRNVPGGCRFDVVLPRLVPTP
ncbi:sensor histidine kinase [Luteimicrobium subarcticum]|uniref:histidine kinase n=1 Tax=Luteimicrobium subarcticum TaxID=620910 RepID=A0A2M8W1U4_9MICO|nr:HAMP domain-containing sensor histidine kinase [Luteimicrobium subarcticum]PJI84878.1 signal transduction histidine kinase [Luteimicrobium subarcticum]